MPTLFITGASSGIGAATARAAVREGWSVGMLARSAEKLAAIADELGASALALSGDATDLAQQEHAIAQILDRFGSLDAAFANAGMGLEKPGIEEGDPAEWRAMIDLNVMGVLYTARAAIPALRRTKGHLVITGSAAGRVHIKGSIYGATKWFVHGLAGNLAEQMREWGGRCTVISPGMVNTGFFDEEKPEKLQPDDIAAAVMFALGQGPRAGVREIHLMPTD